MLHPKDPESPFPPEGLPLVGHVIDRDDPKRLGRVRVVVPGYINEGSAWALPLGLGGGANQHGTKFVPPIGAQVMLFFNCGDVDQPYYIGANAAASENNTGDDNDPDVRTIETAEYVISIDERPESKSLTLHDKAGGGSIQLNGVSRSISLRAVSQIDIEAEGFVNIRGLNVFVNGVQAGLGKL